MRRTIVKKPIKMGPIFRRTEIKSRKPFKFKKVFAYFFAVTSSSAIVYALFFSPFSTIKSFEISGASQINPDDIRKTSEEALGSKPLASNIILVSLQGLKEKLQHDYFVARDVEVRRAWPPTKLSIIVTEREPRIVLKVHDKLYLIGNDGVVSDEIKEVPAGMILLEDLAGVPVNVGKKQFSISFVDFTTAIDSGLKEIGLKTNYFAIPETTFELQVGLEGSYKIFFDTSRKPEDQLKKFNIVKGYMNQNKISPSEYVNISVENRVYWR